MPEPEAVKRVCKTGGCAFVGASLAVLADIVQKGDVSAVVKISTVANTTLGVPLPTIGWAAVLIAFGVALSFVFDADTKKMAFYLGASIIAIVMTATPYTTPEAPEIVSAQPQARIAPASYLVYAQNAPAPEDRLTLQLVLRADAGGEPSPVLISIHDEGTNRTFQRKEQIAPGESKSIGIALARTPTARKIQVRVEGERYKFATAERTVAANAASLELTVQLKPAKSPLWYRRLATPYQF